MASSSGQGCGSAPRISPIIYRALAETRLQHRPTRPPHCRPCRRICGSQTRAVKIRPEIVRRITTCDTDVVFQHLALAPQKGFDLIIGTKVFVYDGEFGQSLARLNMALMLNPVASSSRTISRLAQRPT